MLCSSCGAEEVIDGLFLTTPSEHGAEMSARVIKYKNPEALLFKGKIEIPLATRVCGRCGHVQLFVADLAGLKTTLREVAEDR
jgi:hypothetical protein